MHRWTWASVPSQVGRHAVVTGANRGIGLAVTRALARSGASVTMLCRDVASGDRAAGAVTDALRAEREKPGNSAAPPPGELFVRHCDLLSLNSVRAAAAAITLPVDLLINNAGCMQAEGARTNISRVDGGWPVAAESALPSAAASPHRVALERQVAANHLGHFALAGLLMPRLQQQARPDGSSFAGGKVVAVSSAATWMLLAQNAIPKEIARLAPHLPPPTNAGANPFELAKGEQPFLSYAVSKGFNILFAHELGRRCAARGNGVTAAVAHPGGVDTDIIPPQMMPKALRFLLQSPEDGAAPIVRAATDPEGAAVAFWGPRVNILGTLVYGLPPLPARVPRPCADRAAAAALWAASEAASGISFP